MLYKTRRTATVVASKPSPKTGTIMVYRLKDTTFRGMVGSDVVTSLRSHIREIQSVVDILSGADTKVKKGTIIRPYKPSSPWLWRQWSGTVLQYVWFKVVVMMVTTALIGIIISVMIREYAPESEEAILHQLELIGGWWTKYVILIPTRIILSMSYLCSSILFRKLEF